jgi:tetratricopeptide (TPR) repeat protein
MLGIVAGHYDYDWVEAGKRFGAAKRDQMSPHLRQWHAQFHLLAVGRGNEGAGEHRQVLEEDPLCQTWHYTFGTTLRALGRDEEAIAEMRKSVEIDPDFWLGWLWLAAFLSLQQQHDEALSCAETAIVLAPWSPFALGVSAAALVNVGRSGEAEPYLAQLRDDPYGGPAGLTMYHIERGDADEAMEWAFKAVEQRYTIILITVLRPFQSLLRRSAAWPSLLKKMNLSA